MCRIISKQGRVQVFVQEMMSGQPDMAFVQEFGELPNYFDLEKILSHDSSSGSILDENGNAALE